MERLEQLSWSRVSYKSRSVRKSRNAVIRSEEEGKFMCEKWLFDRSYEPGKLWGNGASRIFLLVMALRLSLVH